MVEEKAPITSYTVWKRSGLSKGFISNKEIISYIATHKSDKGYNARKVTSADILAEKKAILGRENKIYLKRIKNWNTNHITDY